MPTAGALLSRLLIRWEELRRLGRDASPEIICGEDPELIEELRLRIQALEAMAPVLTTDSGAAANCPPAPSPRLASAVGSTFAGYEILGELGHGGMGLVYRAFDRGRNQVVALKTVRQLGPAALERFKREFRALADVAHPNLVTLHELVCDGNVWFFSMELVDGVDFLAYVRATSDPPAAETRGERPSSEMHPGGLEISNGDPRSSGLTPPQFDRLRGALGQLAAGVEALHRAGKLHRDIKPSNVLVTATGRLVLLDFGLVAELAPSGDHLSTEGQVLGTVTYMAPEQAAGLPVGPAADWYSVGVMLYEALTGRLPFCGKPMEVLTAKQAHEPPSPRELVPGVPDDLDRLCAELLQLDSQARPAGPEILRRLGGRPDGPGAHTSLQPTPRQATPLVGRQRHLESLNEAFAAVQRGQTVVFSIQGRSGVGKTALARRFLDNLVERDAAVILMGRCYEQESVPYKALDGVIDALSRYLRHLSDLETRALLPRDVLSLARVFPVLRRVDAIASSPGRTFEVPDPQELRRRAFTALRELLARLGDRRPLVLFIDDLQWGDLDSATLLADLLKPPDQPILLTLACYRSEDIATSPFLQGMLHCREQPGAHLDWRHLEVEPITPSEARDLARMLLESRGSVAEEHIEAIARESGGNPFFVHELAQSVQSLPDGIYISSKCLYIKIDELIMDRVAALPEPVRRLLEIVAVAGRPIRRRDAVMAAELGAEEHAVELLLRASRLIRSTGNPDQGEIETYHDCIREAIIAHLEPTIRKDHHHRLTWALESSGQANPEFLAEHFHGAGEFERASRYFASAANLAAKALAFDRAVKLYCQALELHPAEGSERLRLRMKLGDALANAGRGAEAAREYLSAAAGADPDAALDLRRNAAMQLLFSGHVDEGLATVGVVLKALGLKVATTPRRAMLSYRIRSAWLELRGLEFHERDASQVPAIVLKNIDVCWSMGIGLGLIDVIRGADFQSRNVLLSLSAGEPYRITRALALQAAYTSTGGSFTRPRSAKLLQAAEALARRLAHPYTSAIVDLMGGIVAYLEGRWSDSLASCDRAETGFRDSCIGSAWLEIDFARTFSLWSLTYRGHIAELSRRWPDLLQEAWGRGDLFAATNLSTYIMAIIRLAADKPEDAQCELPNAIGRWSQQGFHIQHQNALLAQLYIHLYRGDGCTAWSHALERWPLYKGSLLFNFQHARIDIVQLRARTAVLAAMTAADPVPLLRDAERAAQRLAREKVATAEAHAQAIRAGIAAVRGDWSRAMEQLTDAAARYDDIDMSLYAAAARRRLGQLIGGDEGRALVTAADTWMTDQSIRDPTRMSAMYIPGFPD